MDANERTALPAAGRGLAATFGLDLRAAALTIIVDLMATSASIISMGLLIPVEIASGCAVALIVYRIQLHWYGDDANSALIKAAIVGLLTAIPVATTPFIIAYCVAGGVLGLRQTIRGRS